MNKTVTINLGGIVFHIDENAYEVLKQYLHSLKQHFTASEGRDEIIADIEARIGEMFQARLTDAKQVIEINDVEDVIRKMGRPEDFAETTEEKSKSNEHAHAAYADLNAPKRLFRHPDDKVLGGVCSGVGAYFGIDPIWLRLAFAAAFFFMGSGFLLYCILWIIMPQAKTTTEKLQMKGERVNVENIEKSIKEEMDGVKQRFKGYASEARDFGKGSGGRARGVLQDVLNALEQIFKAIFKVIGKILAVILIIMSLVMMCILFAALTGSYGILSGDFFMDGDHYSVKDLFFDNGTQYNMALISMALFLGIPLFMLLYKGARMMFNVNYKNKIVNTVAMSLWVVGILMGLLVWFQTSENYKKHYSYKQIVPIIQPKGKTLYIEAVDSTNRNFHFSWNNGSFSFNDNDEDVEVNDLRNVRFNVVKSLTDSFELVQINSAKGKTNDEAISYAEDINYSYSQHDSTLTLNATYSLGKQKKFRVQRVKLILKVPVGKSVYLGQNTGAIIHDIKNVTDTWDGDMPGHNWMMTPAGLKCTDCVEEDSDKHNRKSRHYKHSYNSSNDESKDDNDNSDRY